MHKEEKNTETYGIQVVDCENWQTDLAVYGPIMMPADQYMNFALLPTTHRSACEPSTGSVKGKRRVQTYPALAISGRRRRTVEEKVFNTRFLRLRPVIPFIVLLAN